MRSVPQGALPSSCVDTNCSRHIGECKETGGNVAQGMKVAVVNVLDKEEDGIKETQRFLWVKQIK